MWLTRIKNSKKKRLSGGTGMEKNLEAVQDRGVGGACGICGVGVAAQFE